MPGTLPSVCPHLKNIWSRTADSARIEPGALERVAVEGGTVAGLTLLSASTRVAGTAAIPGRRPHIGS